ncbi:MAG: N-acetylmuramic acid 6-phosphate etherase [Alphaproteobacteria bacterium]|nr:N-acetylmuramic acid 6-phosphate etherase [Alphaproteobacteria bacterium]
MKNILTEQNNPQSKTIDLMETAEIVRTINKEDKKVALAVKKALPEITQAVDIIAKAFLNDGRLAYFGAGTSGRLGVLDASECWPTFSAPSEMIQGFIAGGDYALRHAVEGAEDSKDEALKDLFSFNPKPNDVVVGISASGNPQYILTVLEQARQKGAATIGVTSNPEAKLKSLCDVCIITPVGAEVITGSSRMKSGTAQKMVLNMLSTASMVKIGKTYGNYMVDVQLNNDKLVDRGNRIIASICKISLAKANEYRIKAENNVKTACVMYKKQCTKQEAEQQLTNHNGILRKVIG